MKANFYEFVAQQVLRALPVNWKHIPAEKLLGKPPYQISHAFNTGMNEGKSKLINILVLPLSVTLDKEAENQLIRLRDYILSRKCLLVVISEEENSGLHADTGIFISEDLRVENEYFLWLQCAHDQGGRTTIDGTNFLDLQVMLHELWKGKIAYSGPKEGFQQVNLEIMKDSCWKCKQEMSTVTGVVFPDKQLRNWASANWKYYNCLLSLSGFSGKNTALIQQFVNQLIVADPAITPVSIKYSQTLKDSYLAASCPSCHALRGNHYAGEKRINYLFDLESRFDGSLVYHTIGLNITKDLVQEVLSEYEACEHTCISGWNKS